MLKSDKLMNMFWRKADGVVWDLMSGKIGVRDSDNNIVTLDGEGDGAQVSINPIDNFGMPVPAFAQNTPAESVNIGDLIYKSKNSMAWVTGVSEVKSGDKKIKKFQTISPNGTSSSMTPPKMNVFGAESGVMVLRSLMNLMPNGKEGVNALQGNMLPFMMMGNQDMDLDSIMPLMLMSQLGTNGDGASSVFGGNLIQTMMMMKMMGGSKGGKNFFDGGKF
jgi:hypothetical protein